VELLNLADYREAAREALSSMAFDRLRLRHRVLQDVSDCDAGVELLGHRTSSPVLVDGGVRRGTDVLKALARSADAVAVGRPVLWGLAVDGRNGVADVLTLLREELAEALALCGCRSPREVSGDLLMDRTHGFR
jgi:isopentenyl diphosphate isomerase/L-lactate dehydrogenase-like FMN-dependent dehydrogenase